MDAETWKTREPDGPEQTVGTLTTLKEWAAAGRITKTDYVWNPILQRWQLAMDTTELNGIVGSVRGVSSQRHAIGGAAAMVLFGLIGMAFIPIIGAFVAFVGLIMFVIIGIRALGSKQA